MYIIFSLGIILRVMTTGKQYISVYLETALLAQIDQYRFDNRYPNRMEAIRHLLTLALAAAPTPDNPRPKKKP